MSRFLSALLAPIERNRRVRIARVRRVSRALGVLLVIAFAVRDFALAVAIGVGLAWWILEWSLQA
jgi:hypothetical protein